MKKLLAKVTLGISLGSLMLLSALPVAAAEDARIRVLHASPDAPAVDVYLNDSIVDALTNVPFGVISDYLTVPAGGHNIKVYATGDTSSAVIDADVTLDSDTSYTIAAINPVASIQPAVFVDDPAFDNHKALVRVVHLSPDAPAVDIAPDGADPADAVIKGLEFPDATDYLALDPGSYDLEVRLAGEATVALQLDALELQPGRAYSVFAIGSAAADALGGNALSALVAMDGQAMPDSSTVDEAVADGVASGTPSVLLLMTAAIGIAAFVILLGRGRFAPTVR